VDDRRQPNNLIDTPVGCSIGILPGGSQECSEKPAQGSGDFV
jgi:hypothetical protein